MPFKVWVSWSSGKDSAFALSEILKQSEYEVVGLVTTVNEAFDRVAMHAVRESLLERQAEALRLPLYKISLPHPCSNEIYEERTKQALAIARREGVTHLLFGDLFLEDVRSYRESLLRDTGITPLFPLWGRSTDVLAREMITSGVKAIVTCVDPKQLAPSFVGKEFDLKFLELLPRETDPCGERGEFHTFVYDSPLYQEPLSVKVGEIVHRDNFYFADVLPL